MIMGIITQGYDNGYNNTGILRDMIMGIITQDSSGI